MEELTKNNFEEKTSKGKCVVDNFANWCGPCKAMAPIFGDLSKEMKGIKFYKLNVDDYPEIAQQFGVMSIPTFILFKNGEPVERIIGGNPKAVMKARIEAGFK